MRVCSKTNPGYNPQNELGYIEQELATIMIIIGLPPHSFAEMTIDDMILRIKSVFPWGLTEANVAWKGLVTEHQSLLTQNLRVLWHRRQLALGAIL
jgi:hypothetical protein